MDLNDVAATCEASSSFSVIVTNLVRDCHHASAGGSIGTFPGWEPSRKTCEFSVNSHKKMEHLARFLWVMENVNGCDGSSVTHARNKRKQLNYAHVEGPGFGPHRRKVFFFSSKLIFFSICVPINTLHLTTRNNVFVCLSHMKRKILTTLVVRVVYLAA